jgi:hypothetical protein
MQASGPVLANPGFEPPYAAVGSGVAGVTGNIANGWYDLSYGTLSAAYSAQTWWPHGGKTCQQVTLESVSANSEFQMGQWVTLPAGSLSTPGMWLRGTPGMRLDMEVIEPVAPWFTYGDSPVYLSSGWQFVSFPAHMAADTPVILMIRGSGPGTFCMDDAALPSVASAITPLPVAQATLADFGMHIDHFTESMGPRNLNFEAPFYPVNSASPAITGKLGEYWVENSDMPGNWVTVAYAANAASPHSGGSAQRMTVTQIAGVAQMAQFAWLRQGQTYTSTIWVRGTPGMLFSYGFRQWDPPWAYIAETAALGTGNWQQLTVTGSPGSPGPSELTVAAYTTGTLDIDDATLTDGTGNTPDLSLPWPSTPVGTWRLWGQAGTTWAYLEPAKGVWDFDLLDAAVAAAEANGTEPTLTLGQTPPWASSQPLVSGAYGVGAAGMPANIQDWIDYVLTVAIRYKGRVRIYEIWNEPNDPNSFSGTMAQMVELTETAQTVLKAVDPDIEVVSPAPCIVGWLGQFLAAGGGRYVDVIGYHQYSMGAAPEDDARVLADLRTVLAGAGMSAKPLWITEGAAGDETVTDPDAAMGLLVRKYVIDLTYGAGQLDWFAWGPGTEYCLGTTEADGMTATLAGMGLAQLESWLDGAAVNSVTVGSNGVYAVKLKQANGKPAYIVWSTKGKAVWTVPRGFAVERSIPLSGNSAAAVQVGTIAVTAEPVLIEGSN